MQQTAWPTKSKIFIIWPFREKYADPGLTLNRVYLLLGFPGDLVVKNQPANMRDTGDIGSIPELGRSAGGRNGNCLQYSCLETQAPMDREAWQAVVFGVAKSRTQLSTHTHTQASFSQLLYQVLDGHPYEYHSYENLSI